MEFWRFSCICRNSHISQFCFFVFNEMKTGGNLHRSRHLRQLATKSKEVGIA